MAAPEAVVASSVAVEAAEAPMAMAMLVQEIWVVEAVAELVLWDRLERKR